MTSITIIPRDAPPTREASLRVSVIVGSTGYRRVLITLIRSRLPQAQIEGVDPYSQTMRGSGIEFGTAADVIVLGGIGTEAEALSALQRLRAYPACPPIIVLASHELSPMVPELYAAGAADVLLKDALSRNSLVESILRLTHKSVPPVNALPRLYGQFIFEVDGERVALAIDGYRPLATLSANPQAQVLLVESSATGSRSVVKVWLSTPVHDAVGAQKFCERFAYFSGLNGRSVVRYIDAGIASSWPYVVLEFLAAGDLRRRMAAGLAIESSVKILNGIAAALVDVHAGGFAHMDLKPENIFFRAEGADSTIALIDFNISTRIGDVSRDPVSGDVMGSPFYMSPEQGRGSPIDGRSDLYSVGIIFYEMLTGERPFEGENSTQIIFKHLHGEVPLLPKRIRHLQPVVDRLLTKNPDERFASATELMIALQPFLNVGGTHPGNAFYPGDNSGDKGGGASSS